MKKVLVVCSVFATILMGFWACKTDFSVNGDYKITPIVFGLLDQNESFHYIRINKTFLGDGNAVDFSKVSDSSYFSSVSAKISEVVNGSVVRSWTLRDTILHDKSTNGAFYAPDYKVYYFMTTPDDPNYPTVPNPDRLKDNATYQLEAILNDGAYKVTASTELVTGISATLPSNFTFYNDNSSSPFKSPIIKWDLGTGQVFNIALNFHFNEFVGGVATEVTIPWTLDEISRSDLSGSSGTIAAEGQKFYDLIASSVAENTSVQKRVPYYFELVLTAGSEDVETYMLANQPSTTLAQSKPSFTNITGGLGLFSARTVLRKRMDCVDTLLPCNRRALDQRSTAYLCTGAQTGTLGFCSNNPQDGGTGCSVSTPTQTFYCP